ncbi:MAG: hypothetical protein AAGK33_09240 [Pseudomonadota bacterium]
MSVALTDDTGKIYNFDPLTGDIRYILDVGFQLYDIDFTLEFELYGLNSSNGFYQLDVNTGAATYLTGFAGGANALEGLSESGGFPTMLYGGGSTSTISSYYEGASYALLSLPTGVEAAGDIEVFGGSIFVTAKDGNLYQFSSDFAYVGAYAMGRTDMYGLAQSDGSLYVFADDGAYYRFNGTGLDFIGTTGIDVNGAASLLPLVMDEFASRQDGTGFDDTIIGNKFGNSIYGEEGDDILFPFLGINLVNGGDGEDVAVFTLPPSEYYYETTITGSIWVRWWDGATLVSSTVEQVEFNGTLYDHSQLTTILSASAQQRAWFYGNEYTYGWHYELGWSFGWNFGWHKGWNLGWQYGWNLGWQNGWYFSATTGWTVGWHVGWGVGYYYGWGVGWYQGWGVSWYYGWYADLGWNQAWGWYYGWQAAA